MSVVAIVAIIAVFGGPVYLLKRVLDLRARRLELESTAPKELGSGDVGGGELESLRTENRELLTRLNALEEVVYGGDFELNQKLKALASDNDSPKSLLGK